LPIRNDEVTTDRPLVFDTEWPERAIARALRVGRYKLIHVESDYAGRENVTMLFDLNVDPREQHDLSRGPIARTQRMLEQLDAISEIQRQEAVIAPKREHINEEALRALGYVR
jgi:arylsulfatase A-like enzyme